MRRAEERLLLLCHPLGQDVRPLSAWEYRQLAASFSEENYEDEFLKILSNAQSNIKEFGTGADIYKKFVRSLPLREGISEETALSYFCWMQEMFNAFFSNPEVGGLELDEKIAAHERYIQQFFNLMLYGIAQEKGGNE